MENVLFFREIGEEHYDNVGVKGINLAALSKKGFKVPPGFVITKKVFDSIISRKEMRNMANDLMKCSPEEINDRAGQIQRLIRNSEFSEEITDEIIEAYLSLSVNLESINVMNLLSSEEVFVAVGSSNPQEQTSIPTLSHKTILNVKGKDRLFKAIKDCFAGQYSPDNVLHRRDHNINDASIAVIVQRMVDSEKSGVAYSFNPDRKNADEILIKACFGLGEGISSGNVFPDIYVVDKKNLASKEAKISDKGFEYVRDIDTDDTIKQELGPKSGKEVLSDAEISEISRTVKKISSAFSADQKVEWAIRKNNVYVLQSVMMANEALGKAKSPETVEMEVYGNEELAPGMVDIVTEPDIEEDLLALDEIEKAEKLSNAPQEEELGEIIFPEADVAEQDTAAEAPVVEEEVVKLDDEQKQDDDSIFSVYKGANAILPEEKAEQESGKNRFAEIARLNAGATIIYCHMAIMENLRKKLKQHTKDIPEEIEEMLDTLVHFEKVENADEIRKLIKVKNEFVTNLKYPEPEEVEMALRMLR